MGRGAVSGEDGPRPHLLLSSCCSAPAAPLLLRARVLGRVAEVLRPRLILWFEPSAHLVAKPSEGKISQRATIANNHKMILFGFYSLQHFSWSETIRQHLLFSQRE